MAFPAAYITHWMSLLTSIRTFTWLYGVKNRRLRSGVFRSSASCPILPSSSDHLAAPPLFDPSSAGPISPWRSQCSAPEMMEMEVKEGGNGSEGGLKRPPVQFSRALTRREESHPCVAPFLRPAVLILPDPVL